MRRRMASLSTSTRQAAAFAGSGDWELYAGQWRRHLRGRNLAASTVRGYLVSLGTLASWAVHRGVMSPLRVSRRDLESFLADRQTVPGPSGRAAAATTAAIDVRQLKVFFRWLADVEQIGNPAAGLALPRLDERPVPLFTDAELRALLKACTGRAFLARRDTAIIRVLFDTGIRHGELAALDLLDLDLDEQVIRIAGKGRRTRLVPYGTHTAIAIDDYLRLRARHPDAGLSQLWLAGGHHRGRLGYDGIRLMLGHRARQAGITGRVYAHRFRHTAVSSQLEAGLSEGDAMRIFGWKTRAMLDRYAADAAQRRAVKAARRLSHADRI